jgi:hypothetical protein
MSLTVGNRAQAGNGPAPGPPSARNLLHCLNRDALDVGELRLRAPLDRRLASHALTAARGPAIQWVVPATADRL